MAKYNIIYSCGHQGTVEVEGKQKSRERKLQWYEKEGLCKECYKAKKAAERDEVLAQYAHVLPILKGTEKQIKFASDLRANFIICMKDEKPHVEWEGFRSFDRIQNALKRAGVEYVPLGDGAFSLLYEGKEILKSTAKRVDMLSQDIFSWVLATCNESKWWIESRYSIEEQEYIIDKYIAALISSGYSL